MDETVESFHQALRERKWQDARDDFRRRNYPSSLVDEFMMALEKSRDRYFFYSVAEELLPHCNIEQLDRALATATRNGSWELVGKMLKVGGHETQRTRTIEEACNKAKLMTMTLLLTFCRIVITNTCSQNCRRL
jgi:hypothetical protein